MDAGNQQISGDQNVQVQGDGNTVNVSYHAPAPAIDPVAAQALLDTMPLDEVPEVAALPMPHRMPLPANPRFVGREGDLLALAGALKPGGVAAITTGIGGVGKTQLAGEFAHRYGQYFAGGVFWLSFADPAGVETEIAACGGAGGLGLYADADKLEIAEQIAKVYAAWEQPIPRLLIFDNCEDTEGKGAEDVLAARLPRSGGCRVLVTSRNGQWRDRRVAAQALGTLSREESIALLRDYRADLSEAEAGKITELLGDLPLALSLAGSYLQTYAEEAIGKVATYLKNVEKALLEHRSLQGKGAAPSLTGHEQHVKATFEVSLKRLRPDDPINALALAALARAACLAPGEPFPRELLLATLGDDTEDEDELVKRADALRRLLGLGLLERAEDGALRMHRLLNAFARAAVEDEGAQGAVERALTNRGNATVDAGGPSELQPIIAHLRHAMGAADQRGDADAAALANALGRAEEELTNYPAARPLFERALTIAEQVFGPLHPNTAMSLNNLAGLFYSQGNYAAAQPLFERALTITEQVFGPLHPNTATSLNNLAALLYAQGDYAAAQPLFERALTITEHTLGPLHPDTATRLNNLAGLAYSQGDYAEAQPLFERALTITEQVFGPLHPNTATRLNNLAGLAYSQGDYAEARSLFERALSIREQALGPLHPNTAMSLNNLAALLYAQADYSAAQPLYERAVAIYEQALGPLHPNTAQSLNNLAELFRAQADYPAAQPLYERAVAIYEQALGPLHPDTAQSLNNLALLLYAQGDYPLARSLFERAVAIYEQALGPLHPKIAMSLNNLGALLYTQGDHLAARSLYERAVAIYEQALGPLHPDTAQSLNNLAELFRAQGDYPAARPLYERALSIREHTLGPLHSDTAQSLNNLAALFYRQGDYPAARPLYERALTICEARLGSDHPTTGTVRANLASLDAPPPTAEQQIAEIAAQAQAAVEAAEADPEIDRVGLAQQLEERAQWAEQGKVPGSPYLALAATLRALAARLGVGEGSS